MIIENKLRAASYKGEACGEVTSVIDKRENTNNLER